MTELFVWMLFAISFDLIFGYTGLLSFGQALFFGLGSYTVTISIMKIWVEHRAGSSAFHHHPHDLFLVCRIFLCQTFRNSFCHHHHYFCPDWEYHR